MTHDPSLRAKARRLRLEDRLSLANIGKILGLPRGTVGNWVRDIPLTEMEIKDRCAAAGYARKGATCSPYRRPNKPSKFYLMGDRDSMASWEVGKIAEAAVLFRITLLGWPVFGSIFDGDRVDWVVQHSSGLLTLQVKWGKSVTKASSDTPVFYLPKSKNYQCGDFDFLVGYDLFSDCAFVWSWEEVSDHTAISATPDAEEAWHKLGKAHAGSNPAC